jgi:type I restriction enzyme S subunit
MNKVGDFYAKAFYHNLPTYLEIINKKLAEHYDLQPLYKHIKVVGGYAFKSNEYLDEGVPIIRISDFNNERIDLSDVKKYKESDDLKRYELYSGDIIIAMTGGTIGKLAIVQQGLGKLYLNQRVGKFEVLNKELFHTEYIYWIAKGVQGEVNRIGYGGAQPNISNKQIEALNFPFPDKSTQESIVSFLNDLMNNDLVKSIYFDEELEKEIIRLQFVTINVLTFSKGINDQSLHVAQLRQSILQEAVKGKLVPQDPNDEQASELLEKIKAEKEQLINEKKIKKEKPLPPIAEDEIPYELPQGWEWARLENVFCFQKGFAFKSVDYKSHGLKIAKVSNLNNITSNSSDYVYIDIESKKLYEQYELLIDDIVLTTVGSGPSSPASVVGNAIYIHADFHGSLLNQNAVRLRAYNLLNSEYFYYTLKSEGFKKYIISVAQGTANQSSITQESIKSFLVGIPPLNEQKRIVEKVDQLMALCDELGKTVEQSKQESEMLMKAVLQEVFSVTEKENNMVEFPSANSTDIEDWEIAARSDGEIDSDTKTKIKNRVTELLGKST